MKKTEKFIPGTDPKWGLKLPEGYSNSLVAESGRVWDDGFNYDEKDDKEDETPAFDPEAAERAKQEYLDNQQSKNMEQ